MVKVMASGVFDILHPGHLHYLRQAREMGDELVVIVACDDNVRRFKHEPVTPEDMRCTMVGSLKVVDDALIGRKGDIYDIVRDIEPDIIALGYDQSFDEEDLKSRLEERGISVEIRRVSQCSEDLNGTRKIIQKIIDEHDRRKSHENNRDR